jgi:hypothetical protein
MVVMGGVLLLVDWVQFRRRNTVPRLFRSLGTAPNDDLAWSVVWLIVA